jgi:shikimate kinase
MALDRPVALVGLSGSGKSTVGPLLAEALDAPHLDLDRCIEADSGKSVPAIFNESGEVGFRRLELDVLSEVLGSTPAAVISTGGGVVTTSGARDLLRDGAHVVWLDASPEVLARRLAAPEVMDAEPRPLLGGPQGAEISLQRLFEQRQGWYSELADLRVDVASSTPDEVVEGILESLT